MQPERRLLDSLCVDACRPTKVLAEELGVSRRELAQSLRVLRTLGAPVAARRGRGWKLLREVQLQSPSLIRALLPAPLAARLHALDALLDVDSTNRYLLACTGPGVRACVAERQSAGRGRRGRGWVSPFATSLYLSLRWPSARSAAALSGLSLAMGVAVAEALRGLGAGTVGLKWPNDLVADGAKLGGLLVEMAPRLGHASVPVIGVGVNGRLAADGAVIDQHWTDLHALLGRAPDRDRLVTAVLGALLEAMEVFEQDGLAPFRSRFDALDRLAGREVQVLAARPWHGVARGVDADGALLVESAFGLERVLAGDVSVRVAPPVAAA